MRPRRFPEADTVYRLEGGNEDNDLWVENTANENHEGIMVSVWELNDEERAVIANGGTLELMVWGRGHPPVAIGVGPSMEQRKELTADK